MPRPLLILACSATKIPNGDAPIPAYRRYDGPAYRVLRASGFPLINGGPNCRVMILSAEHGLIHPWRELWDYDREMDEARAAELASLPVRDLQGKLFIGPAGSHRSGWFYHLPPSEVYVWGGALYRRVVEGWEEAGVFDLSLAGLEPVQVRYSRGGIGEQLGQLKSWLAGTKEASHAA